MKSEWKVMRAEEFIEFNPRLSIKKGEIATKVSMDKLKPFTKHIDETEKAAFTGGSKFCNGDTIMARITPCLENGKTAFVDILDKNEVAFGSTEFIVMRSRKGISDPQFVYYLAISPEFRNVAIKSMVGSSGRQRVQQDVLNNVELLVPPLGEQEKIGAFLAALDNKIALNNKINDNLEHQLFLLYSQMIGSSIDKRQQELSTLCQFQEGYVNPSQKHPEYFDGDIKWLRAVDINESFIINTSRTLTQTGFESARKSAILFKPNTIAISKSGTIGRLGIVADYMCGNRAVINIEPYNKDHLAFIYCYLKSKQKEFPDMAVGSVQKNLYISLLEPLSVTMPEQDKLSSFNKMGNTLLSIMRNNCVENIKLGVLRDTLFPKLMSGEIDIENAKFES